MAAKATVHVDDELLSTEFLGFHPGKLYKEIYSVGFNEFIEAVKALKEALHEEFPDKKEEIDKSCDSFLTEYLLTFDKKWFQTFVNYCSKNLFRIASHVPVYDPELTDREANQEAAARLRQLKNKVLAMEYFNSRLIEKIKEVDSEIAKREQLKERIEQVNAKVEVVKKGKELEVELQAIGQPLNEH